MEERSSLHSVRASWRVSGTFCTFLVGNALVVLYSHIGLSFRVKTSLVSDATAGRCTLPSRRLEFQESAGRALSAGNCNSADVGIWRAGKKPFYDEIGSQCGNSCGIQTLSGGACFSACQEEKAGYSSSCAVCFGDRAFCSVQSCLLPCLPPNELSEACESCVIQNCGEAFDECHGMGSWDATDAPTPRPTAPTSTPTVAPTSPTAAPTPLPPDETMAPTAAPTTHPTAVPTTEPTSRPASTSQQQHIVVPMTIAGVEYERLVGNTTLASEFKSAIRAAVAVQAGESISAEQVTVALSPGSVQVVATVHVPASTTFADVRSALEQSLSDATLIDAVVSGVQNLQGIGSASTGTIGAVAQELVVETSQPTPAPASVPGPGEVEYHSVGPAGDISFVNSITRAWENDAEALAVLILIASGVNPYLEVVLLGIAWFVPMTSRSRGWLLWFVNRFGRWSFVDVFCVIIITIGIHFSILNNSVHVKSQSLGAIYAFAIATIWARVQGTFAEECHKPTVRPQLPQNNSNVNVRLLAFSAAVSCILGVVGVVTPFLSFEVIDTTFDRTTFREYSVISLGAELNRADISGGWSFLLMGVPYFIYAVILPLLTAVSILVAFVFDRFGQSRMLDLAIDAGRAIGSASSLDVLLVSGAITATHYGKLLDATLECFKASPAEPDVVSASGSIGLGYWLLLVSLPAQYAMHECIAAWKMPSKSIEDNDTPEKPSAATNRTDTP